MSESISPTKWALRILALPVDCLIAAGVTPNMLSWTNGLLALGAGLLAWKGYFLQAGLVAVFSGLMDVFDGMAARRSHRSTKAGIVLDSTIDRYADFFVFAGLIGFYSGKGFLYYIGAALLALSGSFMVSYAQAKGEAMNVATPPEP